MSGWREKQNRPGQSYRQSASRLRDKLESRKQTNEEEPKLRHPPGLRGREIGLWYAEQNRNKDKVISNQRRPMLTGPNVTLSSETLQKIRVAIENEEAQPISQGPSSFLQDFNHHNDSEFVEILKSSLRPLAEAEPSRLDDDLHDEFIAKAMSEDYVKMLEFRQKLPAHKHKEEIVNLIDHHQVVLIEGNTGCGKTTQVPQFILDDALINKKGSRIKILCTQPRRIAATSIAERVAAERDESLGHSIGYQIRLEKVMPRSCGSIEFCTTGVLLKFIETNQALYNYTHIIIDEIHERDIHIDVCLALLKKITSYRKDLKVILMSATLNAESYSKYFHNCPMMHIEGFTFAVKEIFLEDILEETGYDKFNDQNQRKQSIWVQSKLKKQQKGQEEEFDLTVGNYVRSLRGRYSDKTIQTLMNPNTENIDVQFIEYLIQMISYTKGEGAILVILPGFTVISKLHDNLKNNHKFPREKFVIHPLHSLLTGNDQRNIFIRPPIGVRKIILSTPLAETSITIDDIVYVINAGKMRKPFFDFERTATVLEDQWITKANETQRKGRAGRVQEGFCYHLYTRGRSMSLDIFETPEILRTRLEELLLTIKVVCIKDVKELIRTFIDVPDEPVIDNSIQYLQRLGALTEKEDLTPLGLHLARLACHPQTGKMLLFSSIFSCFDPISTVAASLSFKSPFYTVLGKEDSCNESKRRFSKDSDLLAMAQALFEWKRQKYSRQFCYQNFLSDTILQMLERMKQQFSESLHKTNFLETSKCEEASINQHSENIDVLRAVICASLYPNIAFRAVKVSRNRQRQIVKTASRSVKLFPSSVNSDKSSTYDPGFLVFHQQQKLNNQIFLMETTSNVRPFAILIFGDRISTKYEENTHYISVGDIVQFKCSSDTAELIVELRKSFNRVLEKIIAEPTSIERNSADGKLLREIIELFSFDSKNTFVVEDDDDSDE